MDRDELKKDYFQKEDKDLEDIMTCTKEIRQNPCNPNNYVNRSRHFVKISQYFYALEDARKLIYDLCPKASTGYKLLSEIYSHAELYERAINSLETGFSICGKEFKEYERLKSRAQHKLKLQQQGEKTLLFMFIIIGVTVGIGLVFIKKRFLWPHAENHSQTANLVILFLCPFLSLLTYFSARHIRRRSRELSIEPPYDILGDSDRQKMRIICPELSEYLGDKKAF